MEFLQIINFLEENVKATPESLGDMHKETPEERAERHERVLASSLIAMRNLLDVLLPAVSSEPRGMQKNQISQAVCIDCCTLEMLLGPGCAVLAANSTEGRVAWCPQPVCAEDVAEEFSTHLSDVPICCR